MTDRNITVGIDFSECAVAALGEARRIAAALGARIELVHVSEPVAAPVRRSSSRWSARPRCSGGESYVERSGVPWVELSRHVRTSRPLMLVVGSHGLSGYHPLRPGSTAARLAVSAPCPVLIVSPSGGGPEREAASSHDENAAADCTDTIPEGEDR